jgi:hypothetical protein
MKTIGILGSTRKGGNTEILLDVALEEAQQKGRYAGEKGAIKNDASAMMMAKAMVHQMRALFQANLKYPEEFDMPLHRLIHEKYGL